MNKIAPCNDPISPMLHYSGHMLTPPPHTHTHTESASCSPTCDLNAGCLGPVSGALCGSCTILAGGVNPCDIIPPAPSSVDSSTTLIIVGVVVGIVAVVLLVLVPLGIWGCVVVGRRYHALRQGSFDISVSDS